MDNARFLGGRDRQRFGDWVSVLQHFNKWKAKGSQSNVDISTVPVDGDGTKGQPPESIPPQPLMTSHAPTRRVTKPPQLYGEPIDFVACAMLRSTSKVSCICLEW